MGGSASEPVRPVGTVSPVKNLLDPSSASAPLKAEAPAQKPQIGISARLQTLKKLLDDGLIDDAEFKQHKQRILGDL
jgi:hypothetical protein